MWTRTRTPPDPSSVNVAVPVTVLPLFDSIVAFAWGPSAGAEVAAAPAAGADVPEAPDEAQPAARSAIAVAARAPGMILTFILSSFAFGLGENTASNGEANATAMLEVPPLEVSRITLLGLVAVGAVVAVATSGAVAQFGGGFAAGAGAVLVLSRAMRRPAGEPPGGEEGGS